MTFLKRDMIGVVLLAVISLVVGLAINAWRIPPLPVTYVSPELRLRKIVDGLQAGLPSSTAKAEKISLTLLREQVGKQEAIILIDARPSVFYQMGHLPGAWPLSRGAFEKEYLALRAKLQTNRGRRIIVYCSDVNCHDSEWVAQALIALGFNHVSFFSGGYAEWKQAGFPITQD